MSITGANTTFAIAVTGLFPSPVLLQGYTADDVFTVDDIETAETIMGVDGNLSGGFVNVAVPQTVAFQADSPSIDLFDQWNAAQYALQDVYTANGVVIFTSLGKKWTLTKGFLTRFKPMSDVKKLLQPRHFRLTWQNVSPSAV